LSCGRYPARRRGDGELAEEQHLEKSVESDGYEDEQQSQYQGLVLRPSETVPPPIKNLVHGGIPFCDALLRKDSQRQKVPGGCASEDAVSDRIEREA